MKYKIIFIHCDWRCAVYSLRHAILQTPFYKLWDGFMFKGRDEMFRNGGVRMDHLVLFKSQRWCNLVTHKFLEVRPATKDDNKVSNNSQTQFSVSTKNLTTIKARCCLLLDWSFIEFLWACPYLMTRHLAINQSQSK